MDQISTATDSNLITATMNLDLSAAFDTVDHTLLHQKLQFYGLDQVTLDWIGSYLENRSSYTVIGSASSNIRSTHYGVPQGSVLGPLLYLIFVNEMPSVIERDNCQNEVHVDVTRLFGKACSDCGNFPMFADDGQYAIASDSRHWNQERIEESFWMIRDFLNANGLHVNEGKTSLTEFMARQKRVRTIGIPPDLTVTCEVKDRNGDLRMEDRLITDSSTCRLLGMTLQSNLTWDSHLSVGKKAVIPAVRRNLGMISKVCKHISKKGRLQLANALAISKLQYMICLWGNSSSTYLKRTQVLQNQAARLITGMRKTTRQRELLQECGWLDIEHMTQYFSLLQMWKSVWWKIPAYMDDMIARLDDGFLATHPPRLLITRAAYRSKTTQSWNQLPSHLREERTIAKFKAGIRLWLREKMQEKDGTHNARPPDTNVD